MYFVKYKGRYYYGYRHVEDDTTVVVLCTKNKTEGFELHYDEYRKYIQPEDVEEFFNLKYYARVMDEDNEIISPKNYMTSVDIYGPYVWEKYFEPIARFDIGYGVLRVPIEQVDYILRDITSYTGPEFDRIKAKPERTRLMVKEFQDYHSSIVNNLCWFNENY